jgi:DNA-binding NarL/FixJ family response regulator
MSTDLHASRALPAPEARCAELARRLGRRLSIALLEDEPHTRDAIVARLRLAPDLDVIACESTLAAMRARLERQRPDVLIADLGLPDGSGLDLIAEVHRRFPEVHILVLTVLQDERKLIDAIERGARGYLLKDESAIGLLDAVVEVLGGGAPISPAIARYLVRRFATPGASRADDAASIELSEREQQVLEFAAKGYTHAEIAELIGVSVTTVASYTRRVYEKLQVHSRSAAIYEATRLGLIDVR